MESYYSGSEPYYSYQPELTVPQTVCYARRSLSFDVAAPGISAWVLLLGKHYSPSATNMQAQYPGSG